jgi:hypothetical protein
MRTAKACGPDTPTLVSSCAKRVSRGDGGYQSPDTGEITLSARKPSRRECRLIRLILWYLPPAFFAAGGPWVRPSPGIPCALLVEGVIRKPRANHAARMPTLVIE